MISKCLLNSADVFKVYHDTYHGKNIDKFCEVRFGSGVHTVESTKANRTAIELTVASSKFRLWERSRRRKDPASDPLIGTSQAGQSAADLGHFIRDAVRSAEFWDDVDMVVTVLAGLLKTLRVADGNLPSSGAYNAYVHVQHVHVLLCSHGHVHALDR